MDFSNRTSRPQQSGGPDGLDSTPSGVKNTKSSKFGKFKKHALLNVTYIGLLLSITIVMIGVLLALFLFDTDKNKESNYVDVNSYQAVFLNGGQVYFGKIVDLNENYVSLSDIYYLTPSQPVQSDNGKTTQSNNFTIRKLGCELHRPQDVMVIDHSQVIFWENLKDDSGQNTVPGAIKQLAEQPQNCDAPQTQSSDSSSGDTSNSSDNSSSTTDNSSSN